MKTGLQLHKDVIEELRWDPQRALRQKRQLRLA